MIEKTSPIARFLVIAAAFVVGAIVVRYLLNFVSSYGFAPFAWWRIAVGGAGIIALLTMGGA